jgi:hypothetical protein
MVVVGSPDQGVTPLHLFRYLPPSTWLRRRILWADGLVTIWRRSDPAPFGNEEKTSKQEIDCLRSVDPFQRGI